MEVHSGLDPEDAACSAGNTCALRSWLGETDEFNRSQDTHKSHYTEPIQPYQSFTVHVWYKMPNTDLASFGWSCYAVYWGVGIHSVGSGKSAKMRQTT